MAKYSCISAEVRKVENGNNQGRPYAVAKFSPKGVSLLVAPSPKTMTFFCEFGEDMYDEWSSMWEAVANKQEKLEIDAIELSIDMPEHYKLDSNGDEFTNTSTGEVMIFNKINLFVLADAKGNPIGNPQAEADRIYRNSCRPVSAAPVQQAQKPAAAMVTGAMSGEVPPVQPQAQPVQQPGATNNF